MTYLSSTDAEATVVLVAFLLPDQIKDPLGFHPGTQKAIDKKNEWNLLDLLCYSILLVIPFFIVFLWLVYNCFYYNAVPILDNF